MRHGLDTGGPRPAGTTVERDVPLQSPVHCGCFYGSASEIFEICRYRNQPNALLETLCARPPESVSSVGRADAGWGFRGGKAVPRSGSDADAGGLFAANELAAGDVGLLENDAVEEESPTAGGIGHGAAEGAVQVGKSEAH